MNSTLKELSQWEEKTSKRKFKDDQEKNSPVLLREKGNEYFRTGDFSSALKFYTESLLQGESIEALGNRALVYLKTQEFQKAKNDCDRLLQIDSLNVKGLVRRATAKSSLGDHHGALEDFKLAESREPFNKLIRREREREEAFIQAWQSQSKPTLSFFEEADSDLQPNPEVDKVSLRTAENLNPTPLSEFENNLTTEIHPKTVAQNNNINELALINTLNSLNLSKFLPKDPPETLYSFLKTWRNLKGNKVLRCEFVKSLKDENLTSLFSKSLEPNLFLEILDELEGDEFIRIFFCCSKLPSFPLTKMLLSSSQKMDILSRSQQHESQVREILF